MSEKMPDVIDGIIEYDGPAVYALIDDVGKAYIGSTNNFKQRMKFYSAHFRRVLREWNYNGCLSANFNKALLDGRKFHVAILQRYPKGTERKVLVAAEQNCLDLFASEQELYNMCKTAS